MMRTRGPREKFVSRSSPVRSVEPSFTTMMCKSFRSERRTELMVCTITLSSLCAGMSTVTLGGGLGITARSGRNFSIKASNPIITARPLTITMPRKKGHHFGARFSNQVGNGNKLVALLAKGFDDLRKSCNRLGAIAAAVVQEDDIAIAGLPQHAVDNLFCRDGLAVAQAPVVRIDALAHDQISHFLGERELRHFLGIFRLMIDAVRGTEENRFDVEGAFDQPLGQIQLPADLCVRDLVEFRVGKSVIPDFVTLGEFAFQDIGPFICLVADNEENSWRLLLLQDVKDLGRPLGVGTVVERDGNFLLRATYAIDVIGQRDGVVRLVGK